MGRKNKKNFKNAGGASQNPPPQAAQASKSEAASSSSAPPQPAEPVPAPEKPAPVIADLPKGAKRDVNELVTQLLEKCSKPPESGAKEWDDYPEVHGLVEKIRKVQSVLTPTEKARDSQFPDFIAWLNTNGVDTSAVEIAEFPDVGHGLKATRDLKEADKLLQIPRKLMLTVDAAKQTALGPLIAEDRILQVMPNVILALFLLNEKLNPDSFWKPYIDILPREYTTPLYWGPDDLNVLKGSPVQGDAISQYRNIARQYAYFYRLLQKNPAASKLLLKDSFTYDNYRWAVSSVMTRQNQIPAKDGSRATLGLIPLWDMCNHTNGIYSSDYNAEADACECFCLKDFAPDQQILIFYGPRSNGEFLVHNGFVYSDNEHDQLRLKLGISKGDSLFSLKSELLGKLNLPPSRSFFLHRGRWPVDGDLLAFLRVFSMDEDTLKSKYCGDSAPGPEELESLKVEDTVVHADNEEKVWSFLQTRVSLLLKAYPCSLEDDEAVLEKGDSSDISKMGSRLRIGERRILKNTIDYCETKKEGLKSSS